MSNKLSTINLRKFSQESETHGHAFMCKYIFIGIHTSYIYKIYKIHNYIQNYSNSNYKKYKFKTASHWQIKFNSKLLLKIFGQMLIAPYIYMHTYIHANLHAQRITSACKHIDTRLCSLLLGVYISVCRRFTELQFTLIACVMNLHTHIRI